MLLTKGLPCSLLLIVVQVLALASDLLLEILVRKYLRIAIMPLSLTSFCVSQDPCLPVLEVNPTSHKQISRNTPPNPAPQTEFVGSLSSRALGVERQDVIQSLKSALSLLLSLLASPCLHSHPGRSKFLLH